MSNGSDPASVLAALKRAQDIFEIIRRGRAEFGDEVSAEPVWDTQLTKACGFFEVIHILKNFQDHMSSSECSHQIGLFERETTEKMKDFYCENRTGSYTAAVVQPKSNRTQ
jgi:hypothetical protein